MDLQAFQTALSRIEAQLSSGEQYGARKNATPQHVDPTMYSEIRIVSLPDTTPASTPLPMPTIRENAIPFGGVSINGDLAWSTCAGKQNNKASILRLTQLPSYVEVAAVDLEYEIVAVEEVNIVSKSYRRLVVCLATGSKSSQLVLIDPLQAAGCSTQARPKVNFLVTCMTHFFTESKVRSHAKCTSRIASNRIPICIRTMFTLHHTRSGFSNHYINSLI